MPIITQEKLGIIITTNTGATLTMDREHKLIRLFILATNITMRFGTVLKLYLAMGTAIKAKR